MLSISHFVDSSADAYALPDLLFLVYYNLRILLSHCVICLYQLLEKLNSMPSGLDWVLVAILTRIADLTY